MLKLWNVFSDFSAYRSIFWTFRRVRMKSIQIFVITLFIVRHSIISAQFKNHDGLGKVTQIIVHDLKIF